MLTSSGHSHVSNEAINRLSAGSEETNRLLRALIERLDKSEQKEYREPHDFDVQIFDTQEWKVNLFGRKHLFVISPANLTLIVLGFGGDAGLQLTINKGVWFNLGLFEGSAIKTSGQASAVNVHFRATDEIIP